MTLAETLAAGGAAPAAGVRLRGAAVLAACLCAWFEAGALRPAPEGFGTHCQLGLPYCSSLALTGYPCPTCGLTTSLAAIARGELAAAWSAHPFGLVIAAAAAALALAGAAELATGRNVLGRIRPRPWWVAAAIAGLAAGWGCKLAAGVLAGRFPLR